MAESKILRNQRIYRLVSEGEPIAKIAEDHGISVNRVRQIVDKMESAYDKGDNELYQAILRAGRGIYCPMNVVDMAYKRLTRFGVKTLEDLIDIDLEEYERQWFIGEVQKTIVVDAIEIAKNILYEEE